MPPTKRKSANVEQPENATKIWRGNPPGLEQKEVNRCIAYIPELYESRSPLPEYFADFKEARNFPSSATGSRDLKFNMADDDIICQLRLANCIIKSD